jgi:carbon storage regulator CsrA
MLVLSRKPGEAIWIDETIEVNILEIQGNRVRLGISAPLDVSVLRSELQPHAALLDAGVNSAPVAAGPAFGKAK